MSAHDPIPENLQEYFGHDKVAHHGSGGLPAAPPAPPGSTARKAGENAVADGLAKAGTPGRAPGRPPGGRSRRRPALPRKMRAGGRARALRALDAPPRPDRQGAPAPHEAAGWFWSGLFAPVYSAIPWGIKRAWSR